MYQGKFDAKKRGQSAPDEALQNILEERSAAQEAAKKAQAAQAARKAAAAKAQASAQKSQQPKAAQPAKPAAQQPVKTAAPQPAAKTAKAAPKQPTKPVKKGPSTGSLIFYTLYFLFIAIFCGGTWLGLQWLNGWLVDYEAAQPTVKCEEVFNELFSDPDWNKLYELAGIQNTDYEGVEQYVAYMEEKVGDKPLNYVETSSGSASAKKYIVRLDTEKIATFTLDGKGDKPTDIPDWKLGKVELFFSRQQGYLIQKLDGHTAYVNGVPLDDSFTIQVASTKAEEYLPIGTSGVRTCIQSISNLMAMPTVEVYNQTGEQLEVVYDEATGTFVEQTVANTMPEDEKNLALNAIKSFGEFMINASGGRAGVAKYFDGSSETYTRISKMASELWMNHDYGHYFKDESVDGYCKYSDNLFSVHASITMACTLKDGSTRDYTIDQSLFFTKKNGSWICYEMTNEDITQPVGKVRLTFVSDGNVLASDFYNTSVTELLTPVVSAPEGKVFSGWFKETYDEKGKKTLVLVFTPDETGKVTLNSGSALEPMTLYTLFETPAEGGSEA